MSRKESYQDMSQEWDERKLPADEKEDELDATDRRMYIRMAIETTLAVGLVVAVTIIVLATNNGYKCCNPQESVPEPLKDMRHIKNISSIDSKAIVAFSGYLKFLQGKGGKVNQTQLERNPQAADFLYLPLNLTSVKLGPLVDSPLPPHQVMNLTTDCAILSFHLNFHEQNSTIHVSSIDIESIGQRSGYVESSVVRPTAIQVGKAESYVCPFRQEYPVRLLAPSNRRKRMVSIVFDILNFEVNEEPRDELKVGLFSKPAHYCYSPNLKPATDRSN